MLYLVKTSKRTVKAFSTNEMAVEWVKNKVSKSNKLNYVIVPFNY